MASRVMVIWSAASKVGRQNLEYGLSTQTWGFKQPVPEADSTSIDFVVFAFGFSEGSVRITSEAWQQGSCNVLIGEFSAPFYVGTAPHWPDEIEAHEVIYPYRFGFTPVGQLADVSLDGAGLLPPELAEGLRLAAIGNRPVIVETDLAGLFAELDVALAPASEKVDLSTTVSMGTETKSGPGGGAAHATDAALRTAVERHSVEMAKQHFLSLGYTDVEELGKPYDLVCRAPGKEKHVEVKGTTGAGVEVEYTVNEVHHFRNCPHGADLVVVRDIKVDKTSTPYTTSGGELLHVENYLAPREDLQPTRFLGRVEGWTSK